MTTGAVIDVHTCAVPDAVEGLYTHCEQRRAEDGFVSRKSLHDSLS